MTILTQVEPVEIESPKSDPEAIARDRDIARDYIAYGLAALNLYFQKRSDV
ncbi:hypothetical protein [Microcoleus sp. herbarium12]|uniref:hypothetical protein n=1 Tax=Microcoleus sp. herbarium12 TaxID=3055437 RepID=UPI002FD199F4